MIRGEERADLQQGGIESGKAALEPQDPQDSEERGRIGAHAGTGPEGFIQTQIE
jgi:hypothetical protein